MHPHNRYAGAARILAVAAKDRPVWTAPSIPGHVQHDHDLLAPCAAAEELHPSLTAFVWDTAALRRRARLGRRNQVAIGAPFLYLTDRTWRSLDALGSGAPRLDTTAEVDLPDPPIEHLLFVHHGVGGVTTAQRTVAALRDRGVERITVALSDRDHRTAPILQTYADLGVTVEPLGPVLAEEGSYEPTALERLDALLSRSRAVSANTERVELLYATARDVPTTLLAKRDLFPADPSDAEAFGQFAAAALGTDHLCTPEELADLFEWSRRA